MSHYALKSSCLNLRYFLIFAGVFWLSACGEAKPDIYEDPESFWDSVAKTIYGEKSNDGKLEAVSDSQLKKYFERGAYLVRAAAACGMCHAAIDSQLPRGDVHEVLSGGRVLEDQFGPLVTANITPATGTGIGSWTPEEISRAIRSSLGKGDRALSLEAHLSYRWLSDQDMRAITVYLLSLNAVEREIPRRELGFFERKRWGLFSRHEEVRGYVPTPATVNKQIYGKYLYNNVSQCVLCHGAQGAGPSGSGSSLWTLVSNLFAPNEIDAATEALIAKPSAEQVKHLEQADFPLPGPDIRGGASGRLASWTTENYLEHFAKGRSLGCPVEYYNKMTAEDQQSLAEYLKAM
ncbi:hypothetical protein JNK13_02835 [bacterium]|nr:hypothetical protein [bacterium]